jgi:anti-sigma regulatory factor (Ser/Thr protein kinase)
MVPKPDDHVFGRSYPSHASFALAARRDLRAFAQRCGVAAGDLDDIYLALGEVFAEAVQRKHGKSHGFSVSARYFTDRIEISVESDEARFGVRTAVRDPAYDTMAPRGLGMLIVRKLMTTVTLSGDGRKIQLVKRLTSS